MVTLLVCSNFVCLIGLLGIYIFMYRSGGGVLTNVTAELPSFIINGGAHHLGNIRICLLLRHLPDVNELINFLLFSEIVIQRLT
jgi:hypothetical protein